MMATKLMRDRLTRLYGAAQDAHPGLLLQRGLAEYEENDQTAKKEHIDKVCVSRAGDFYKRAYERWQKATSNTMRFRQVFLKLNTRMFIGLTGGGMLETGCAISHSYGMPYVPGSSIKGIVNAYVRERFGKDGKEICDELFGAPATEAQPAGLSGLIAFHDAWWAPDSATYPLLQEVVTTHHQDYYGKKGKARATDFDSPVPNAQVAVQGTFLFVLEGPLAWLELAEQMLIDALETRGAGAKTRAGYGLFKEDEKLRKQKEEAERREREEAARREKEADEQRREEAERQRRAGLSEGRKRIEDLERQVVKFKEAAGTRRQSGIRKQVKEAANRLIKGDFDWTNAAEREAAAEALEKCYDTIGWFDPEKKGKQRTKQKKKRRTNVEKLRSSS